MSASGNYSAAIDILRRVVEKEPSSSLYWNDLGVTELKNGELESAKMHFVKALSLDSKNEIAKTNLEDIVKFHANISPDDTRSSRNVHNLRCLRRLKMELLLGLDKEQSLKLLDTPFIIVPRREARKRIRARQKQFSFSNLDLAYGHVLTDFYPDGMYYSKVQPQFTSMNRSLSHLLKYRAEKESAGKRKEGDEAEGPGPRGPYIQWNMNYREFNEIADGSRVVIPPAMDDRFWLPMCFEEEAELSSYLKKTHWKMMLIGEQNAGMFNHQDTLRASSWQLQIEGFKTWHLCSPSQSPFMYEAGSVDAFDPDYEKYPLFKNANCFQDTLQPGEYIYYPIDYWHQTRNDGSPSISISSSVITAGNFKEVIIELEEECAGRGAIFSPHGKTCDILKSKCYSMWRDMFFSNDIAKSSHRVQQYEP